MPRVQATAAPGAQPAFEAGSRLGHVPPAGSSNASIQGPFDSGCRHNLCCSNHEAGKFCDVEGRIFLASRISKQEEKLR